VGAAHLNGMQSPPGRFDGPPREKILNAPPVAALLALSMPVLFLLQQRLPDGGLSYAFLPSSLVYGDWWPGLFSAMLVHGGWGHVLANAIAALAFGPPVARLFPGLRGAAVFLAFYIVCGLVASIGYGLVHLGSNDPVVGASGAVFGLMGAALRLLGSRGGQLRAITDRRVLSAAAVIMAVNAATGLIGFAPGVEGARIAWEAHAAGFVFGLLTIGPVARVFGRKSS
jgi:membrane associated rhomboid family serine protease